MPTLRHILGLSLLGLFAACGPDLHDEYGAGGQEAAQGAQAKGSQAVESQTEGAQAEESQALGSQTEGTQAEGTGAGGGASAQQAGSDEKSPEDAAPGNASAAAASQGAAAAGDPEAGAATAAGDGGAKQPEAEPSVAVSTVGAGDDAAAKETTDAAEGAEPGTAAVKDANETEELPPVEVPAGTDPADIAAIRGQQAMLQAEAKLKKMLSEGKIEGVDKLLTFEELSSWPYSDGLKGMPPQLEKLDGKKVMMVGFMLPIDQVENMDEFLLVQSLWACCYGQPPDINGIVRVVMKGDNKADYQYDPIRMIGDFKVEAYEEDGYVVDIYQLHIESFEVLR